MDKQTFSQRFSNFDDQFSQQRTQVAPGHESTAQQAYQQEQIACDLAALRTSDNTDEYD